MRVLTGVDSAWVSREAHRLPSVKDPKEVTMKTAVLEDAFIHSFPGLLLCAEWIGGEGEDGGKLSAFAVQVNNSNKKKKENRGEQICTCQSQEHSICVDQVLTITSMHYSFECYSYCYFTNKQQQQLWFPHVKWLNRTLSYSCCLSSRPSWPGKLRT